MFNNSRKNYQGCSKKNKIDEGGKLMKKLKSDYLNLINDLCSFITDGTPKLIEKRLANEIEANKLLDITIFNKDGSRAFKDILSY